MPSFEVIGLENRTRGQIDDFVGKVRAYAPVIKLKFELSANGEQIPQDLTSTYFYLGQAMGEQSRGLPGKILICSDDDEELVRFRIETGL